MSRKGLRAETRTAVSPSGETANETGATAPGAYIIQARGLFMTYRTGELEVPVLKGIDLDIARGEFVAVMGPSGSGKSTLLYLLGGLDRPTAGSVRVNGRELAALGDGEGSRLRRREVGFVFQFYNLIPNLDVEENILLPVLLDGRRTSDFAGRLEEILEVMGLAERRRHTPRQLSGGEQQRVALARSLINDPAIILADEPTGNLDTRMGGEVLQLMSRIHRERGKTMIMVTHDSNAAARAGRVIRVRDGRIEEGVEA